MAAVAPATAAAEVDVAIVGGGMVGASLAAALWGTGVRVLLVESVPFGTGTQPSFDERTTALGNASRRIFEAIGVWPAIASEAAAIRSIHVSEAGRFGFSRLTASEQGVDAFGYVVANRAIGAALWQKLSSSSAPQLLLRMPAHVQDLEIGDARVRFTLRRRRANRGATGGGRRWRALADPRSRRHRGGRGGLRPGRRGRQRRHRPCPRRPRLRALHARGAARGAAAA